MQVTLADVEICERVRSRASKKPDPKIVARYRESFECGAIFPPIVVFREKGTQRFIVADGEHRLEASRGVKIQPEQLPIKVLEGTEIDALEYAISCNDEHGFARSEKDAHHAFERLMETAELKKKYPTHRAKSELLHRSEKTIQRWSADWRESPGGDKTEKLKAKRRAEHFTPKTRTEPKAPEAKPTPKQPTSEQKKVAAQVRESVKPKASESAWTKADDVAVATILDSLSILGEAWKTATRAAQIHCRDVLQKTLREMV